MAQTQQVRGGMGNHWPTRLQPDVLQGAKRGGAPLHSDLSRLVLRRDHDVLAADLCDESRGWIVACHGGVPLIEVSRAQFTAEVRAELGPRLLDEAVSGLERRFPHLSARRVVTPGQIVFFVIVALMLALGLAFAAASLLRFATIALSLLFVVSGAFRTALALLGSTRHGDTPAPRPDPDGLPSYTILVPMYGEAAVLPGLVRALAALD